MSRVHLVLLWHMHQPQYRDPATGRYLLPWTRLHALKDYWGMVHLLRQFPGIHATFNIVPSLARQIEEYASGKFDDPWFTLAFKPAASLTQSEKCEILQRAFQVNHENLMSRWPRFVELFGWTRDSEPVRAAEQFSLRDWRDLQLLSQLVWMDEDYLANDPVVSALARQGSDFSEKDKQNLRERQSDLLSHVLPEYTQAAERGQIEISTTPFYHPILPLVCDSGIARVANPNPPSLAPAFQHPEDAREQLTRARQYHQYLFGASPAGLWPSEGSVSDEALSIAADLGFKWFATDEGILGRTLNIGFWRDSTGYPENAAELYSPWKFRTGENEICGLFRDHYLSDLIGFVYSRMDAAAAAEDFHRRLHMIADRNSDGKPATVSIILDGENAWEYYPGNGREFLRQLYARIERDPEIRALTVSEAISSAGEIKTLKGIFPGSWINANFDIWIGDAEDIRAWELLRDARTAYAKARDALQREASPDASTDLNLSRAYEALLAAEGSDWCWWYGPEHSSANDAEFDELYRKHLAEVYAALGLEAPEALAQPLKRIERPARAVPPADWLRVEVDGRITSYFEWLGAGRYSSERRGGAMHGQSYFLDELQYGFSAEKMFVRVDLLPEALVRLQEYELRCLFHDKGELKLTLRVLDGKLAAFTVERDGKEFAYKPGQATVALDKIAELEIAKDLFNLSGQRTIRMGVSIWRGGLPVDTLPSEGNLEILLGEENFSWPAEPAS
ncbi:MAG TPA: glycoside hydrolase family 57 protein [Candidatus Acidoferrales bacterium]|nr:glycoside hydrolase family 57 protein [Candidatus Acidoferrales bacterium]